MKKNSISLMLVFLMHGIATATGLVFNTDSGEILQSNSDVIADGALIRFGKLSSTAGSTIGDFEANFEEIITASFSGGDVSVVSLPPSSPFGDEVGNIIYGIAYAGASSGNVAAAVFEVGEIPSFGFLTAGPQTVTNVLYGTKSGNNILLSPVPEPSTYAAISGFLALGWVMLRRRRA